MAVDLRKEQEATLARPRAAYGMLARLMFLSMDIFYGRKLTLPKMKFLETLARIPYQAWEIRQYWRLGSGSPDAARRGEAEEVLSWSREAQDNEYWHLVAVTEKMKQDGVRASWLWFRAVPWFAAQGYAVFSRRLAFVSIRSAWKLNAQFEDHAEHCIMQFVRDNPQMENEPVESEAVHDGRGPDGGRYPSWADVFRRAGLDEREHMNESLRRCGLADKVVP